MIRDINRSEDYNDIERFTSLERRHPRNYTDEGKYF